ncbi:MAG: PrsW family glutamic-type intramembrane protease [Candidatus Pacebacteria bacterium]|nr:PrsW family glutamic-type intramembrane protease [Candidatus Paceibacterota bacterium]MDD4830680.1 PrsW family glutamic-type intramembrane protease [Candidatus Paceibacterota bacterium]MDD4875240.1 PrsW family glutamic-type intramembrane protease [Candidatus Paceibacterota bacterium]
MIPDILFYTSLAILPSLLWLLFFLKQDKNPEPKTRILVIFLLGLVSAVPVVAAESILLGTAEGFFGADPAEFFIAAGKALFEIFIAVALIEEIFKYFVVRLAVFGQQDFDEPIDVPVYMIASALGFAAAENILIMNNTIYETAADPYILITARFLGATFLHALTSSLFGCFIAVSFNKLRKRNFYFFCGLASATILHGFYNFFIINSREHLQFDFLFASLTGVAILVFVFFKKIKKLKSVCKIN